MEEKEIKIQIKLKLKTVAIIACAIIIILGGFIIYFFYEKNNNSGKLFNDYVYSELYNDKEYYIIKKDYDGEYDLQVRDFNEFYDDYTKQDDFEKKEIMSFSEYQKFCNTWGLKTKYSNTSKNYIVYSYVIHGLDAKVSLGYVSYNRQDVDLYIWDKVNGITADISACFIVIPTEKNIENVNIIPLYKTSEIQKNNSNFEMDIVKKPIIYLYPEKELEVFLKLVNEENVICSYPKYEHKWQVLAKPNGELQDIKTRRNLYSLYYESECVTNIGVEKEGFVVEGKNTIKFLEEKLLLLGLTEKESEEFIIYWLPILENNKYNYIRFLTQEEINENMPLEVEPKPDSIIRVIMAFKPLEEYIEVKEQEIVTPERTGFVLVEWGGTEIKEKDF